MSLMASELIRKLAENITMHGDCEVDFRCMGEEGYRQEEVDDVYASSADGSDTRLIIA